MFIFISIFICGCIHLYICICAQIPNISCSMVVHVYAYYEIYNYDHHICSIASRGSPNFLRSALSHAPEARCHMSPAA